MIEERAFCKYKSIEEFVAPSGVVILGGVFFECISMKKITFELPCPIDAIGMNTFECCIIKTIFLPPSITKIGKNAFKGCRLLESVEIPDSVTTIESCAFLWCHSLVKMSLPVSVATVIFHKCINLR